MGRSLFQKVIIPKQTEKFWNKSVEFLKENRYRTCLNVGMLHFLMSASSGIFSASFMRIWYQEVSLTLTASLNAIC